MRALKAIAKVLLGLVIGLVIAEFAFSLRDGGAFPHLNLYEPDPALGVKLRPNAEMKLRVADTNPVTTVRTNALGYRGGAWPEPTKGEVLVVGDSQVFGLGVEEDETFSAKLSKQLGVPVLNAGVPTYGPREYTAVVEDVLRTRKPATVIYVMNLSNDLFEVDRSNASRHTVWDGWAVRTETAPKAVASFPFRDTLMRRSHLVFAMRRLMHTAADAATNPGFETEGTWKDVVQASTGVTAPAPEDENVRKTLEQRAALAKQLDEVDDLLRDEISQQIDDDSRFADGMKKLVPKDGDPRDIVQVRYAEGARRVDETAYQLFMAALGEERNDALLTKLADKPSLSGLRARLEQRRALRAQAGNLKQEALKLAPRPVDAVFEKTKAACDAVGARLVIVALPLDVMVSADEWKKYGVTPIDMSPTRVLVEDLVARADQLGALGVDPTGALAAVEPGAFLDGDLHMTPKGHAALAQYLASELARPPKPKSALSLPPGRSWPPTDDEWRREKECTVKGSSALRCETKLVREWLRLSCERVEYDENERRVDVLSEVVVTQGGHGDWRAYQQGTVNLLIPVLPGDETRVRFGWKKKTHELTLSWPKGGAYAFSFGPAVPADPRRELPGFEYVRTPFAGPTDTVTCAGGQVPGGALRTCATPCDATTPCAEGSCIPWPAGGYCAKP